MKIDRNSIGVEFSPFWHSHLGGGSEAYSYAWLRTVHDRKHDRLALYLMAVLIRELAFYHALFARSLSASANDACLSNLMRPRNLQCCAN